MANSTNTYNAHSDIKSIKMESSSGKINIIYEDLPESIPGCCSLRPNGNYLIIINSNLTESEQAEALEHELYHIENNDFYSSEPVDTIEYRAHNRQ